jgi:hypothetical protein
MHTQTSKRILIVFFAMLIAMVLLVAPAQAARASAINVPCGDVAALIAAINTTNSTSGATVIELAANCTYTLTGPNNIGYKGSNGLPQIGTDVTINAHGSTIQRSIAPETRQFRIFQINDWGRLALNDATLLNGFNDDLQNDIEKGGAIANFGQLAVTNSTFSNNRAGCGAAIFTDIPGAPISTTPTVTVTHSVFSDNPADA